MSGEKHEVGVEDSRPDYSCELRLLVSGQTRSICRVERCTQSIFLLER